MIQPDHDRILAAVIAGIERDVEPQADEYAASVCRTAAQMLRHVRARLRDEPAALETGNAELRELLSSLVADAETIGLATGVASTIASAVAAEPAPLRPDLADLRADALRLRAALASLIDALPADHPARHSARTWIARQLAREAAWQQDAFTGPRR